MIVLQKNNNIEGMFYIISKNKITAEMTYVWAGTKRIIIDHTFASEEIARDRASIALAAKAVGFARTNNIKIIPLCLFAKSFFDKVEDYKDVLETSSI
jgi:uncharacterized protein